MTERPDSAEPQRPADEPPASDLDRPIQPDETEYIEKGLNQDDKESR